MPRLTPRRAAAALAALALAAAGGLAWVTSAALAAEEAQRRAAQRQERGNRERLALWRLDGQLLPVLAVENGRPPAHYAASPDSPLLAPDLPAWMRLHFEVDAVGWRTPQATREAELSKLRQRFPPIDTARRFVDRGIVAPPPPSGPELQLGRNPGVQAAAVGKEVERFDQGERRRLSEQSLNYAVNADNNNRLQANAPIGGPGGFGGAPGAAKRAAGARGLRLEPPARFGPLVPCLLTDTEGTELLLVRAVAAESGTVFQGFWIDWPRLSDELAGSVRDLLPDAAVRPLADGQAPPAEALASLPARLDAGPLDALPAAPWTPLRTGLVITWCAASLALAATALGVGAVLRLSERRARFVSAVTHELRTPLTSLRLYLDLLSGGLVTNEETRQEYLATLSAESERLNALIGNVLDFARLENRPAALQIRPVALADLLADLESTWRERCRTRGKELLLVNILPAATELRTDPRLVAQALGNLIDNACKYARDAADPRVWVWAKPGERGGVVLEVEDRGPGVPARERSGIFAAFRRGAGGDVESIGGVGLGLALAREWGRALGGRLTYRPAEGGVGACFRLELPRAVMVRPPGN